MEKEQYRRGWITDVFKQITNRIMTEEEYKEYISIFDNPTTKKGYTLMSFINKENPLIDELNNDIKN